MGREQLNNPYLGILISIGEVKSLDDPLYKIKGDIMITR